MADLSELLKEGTKEAHDRAENTQFVKDFLKGNIRKELFKVCALVMDGVGLAASVPGAAPRGRLGLPTLHSSLTLAVVFRAEVGNTVTSRKQSIHMPKTSASHSFKKRKSFLGV